MWKVYRNGTFTGIVESNYHYAISYWRGREKATGYNFRLVWVN